ncbi:TPA: hypothetical protein SBJ50_002968 [Yersinia enterocolitica]|nr:hypothetical protein [Yersinia enterocolitica]HDM8409149.1 hypothetical protein [Yersinia enterocolitica]HDM9013952.1 hypothetical protein [Yersinia enterocolitica]HEF8856151.1 hypothetical protein [Yersinia enterocolitica]HEG1275450.1 hypothetical protein [Yersinia enterocolitica]
MNDKTEFARAVPAMIQEKASEWLLGKLDEELEALRELGASGVDITQIIPGSINGAKFRARLVRETFIAQYSDEK